MIASCFECSIPPSWSVQLCKLPWVRFQGTISASNINELRRKAPAKSLFPRTYVQTSGWANAASFGRFLEMWTLGPHHTMDQQKCLKRGGCQLKLGIIEKNVWYLKPLYWSSISIRVSHVEVPQLPLRGTQLWSPGHSDRTDVSSRWTASRAGWQGPLNFTIPGIHT